MMLAIFLSIIPIVIPTVAQENSIPFVSPFVFDNWQIFHPGGEPKTEKAPVILDGRQLFRVGQSGEFTAAERADTIQSILQLAVDAPQSPTIRIEQRNQLPVIFVNDQYLLTVTDRDIVRGETREERARLWEITIERAVRQAQRERTPQYLQRQIIIAVVLLFLALLVNRFLGQLQKYPFRQALARIVPGIAQSKTEQQTSPSLTVLIRFKVGVIRIGLWLATVLILTDLFPFSRQWRYQLIYLLTITFTRSLFILGDRPYSLLDLLILFFLFGGLLFITRFLTELLRTRILQLTGMTRGSQEVISIVIKYGFLSFGTIVLLQVWGVNLSSLAIIGSAFGVGVGFGFQDIAKNFASGLVLLFERSIQVGDFIQVDEHMGTVERVGARSIVLKTLDQISIIVPNSRLLADEVTNWSHGNPTSRIHVPVGVAYSSDVQKVKSALLQAANEHLEVLRYPPPQVFFKGFGDNALNFELLVWTSDPSRQLPLSSDLYFRIEEILREHEIEVPFPQRDLNLRTGNLPLTISPQLENLLLDLFKNLTNKPSRNSKSSNRNLNS
ncbi:mechanosensitive ion channel [Pleurocapsales cyanobacterium LEGE 06147]|nr:mechanosensitive ion channel [Pleurocapsales cyanobacterium LEGE 06147]